MDSIIAWFVACIVGLFAAVKIISIIPLDKENKNYTSTEMKFITGRKTK